MSLFQSNWFSLLFPNSKAKLRLFCLPYAGGNAVIFKSWAKNIMSDIEIVAIQPPGRSTRLQETPFKHMDMLIDDLMTVFPSVLDKPYVIFGHSLGSRIGFELLARLQHQELRLPEHFIASGSRGPHIPCLDEISYDLPDDQFVLKLKAMGGTPAELLDSNELMALLLPMIRADFQIAETHHFSGNILLDIPVTVFGGKNDPRVSIQELHTWQQHFSLPADIALFDGGHFFIDTHRHDVIARLDRLLAKTINQLEHRQDRLA